jgi:hypothetical protein
MQAAQVALRARGHEERGFLAQHLRDARLQGVDGGVVGEDVVAHLGGGHGRAHGRQSGG